MKVERPPTLPINSMQRSREPDWPDQGKVNNRFTGCPLVHGSRSASLLAFTQKDGAECVGLLPMGKLMARGLSSFSGESTNALHPRGFNQHYLSTVSTRHAFRVAYEWATNPRCAMSSWSLEKDEIFLQENKPLLVKMENARIEWEKDHLQENRGRPATLKNTCIGGAFEETLRNKVALSELRLKNWPKLNNQEQLLVTENFPIVYGLTIELDNYDIYINSSDVATEYGVSKVGPKEIGVIATVDTHLKPLQDVIDGNPDLAHIKIVPFSAIF